MSTIDSILASHNLETVVDSDSSSSEEEDTNVTHAMLDEFLSAPPVLPKPDADNIAFTNLQQLYETEILAPLKPEDTLHPFGSIITQMNHSVVVSGETLGLDVGSILFWEDGSVLGRIGYLFGPVARPLHIVQFDSNGLERMKNRVGQSMEVFYTPSWGLLPEAEQNGESDGEGDDEDDDLDIAKQSASSSTLPGSVYNPVYGSYDQYSNQSHVFMDGQTPSRAYQGPAR